LGALYNAVRPAQLDHKITAMVEVREPDNRFPQIGWAFHEPSMRQTLRYVKYIIAEICTEMTLTETQFRLLKSRAKSRFGELGKRRLAQGTLNAICMRTSAGASH
jgi:hypothetical protein